MVQVTASNDVRDVTARAWIACRRTTAPVHRPAIHDSSATALGGSTWCWRATGRIVIRALDPLAAEIIVAGRPGM